MSPILVRPVREQLEHDRVIRLLQAKYKRKFETAINPGHEQNAPVGGPPPWFPDLVLQSKETGKILLIIHRVVTSRAWLTAVVRDLAVGRKLEIPENIAKQIARFL